MTTTDTQAMHLVFDLPPEVHPSRRTIPIRVRAWSLLAAVTLGAGACFLVDVTS